MRDHNRNPNTTCDTMQYKREQSAFGGYLDNDESELKKAIMQKVKETGFVDSWGDRPQESTCELLAINLLQGLEPSENWKECKWIDELSIPGKSKLTGKLSAEDLEEF